MSWKDHKPARVTPDQCNLYAIDATDDSPLGLFKRAAILRTALLDVALVGKEAVRARPKIKKTDLLSVTQRAHLVRMNERSRQAAQARRSTIPTHA